MEYLLDVFLPIVGFLFGSLAGIFISLKGVPFIGVERPIQWAIGIYVGKSPVSISPHEAIANPVLTAADVTDIRARFVADPFIAVEGSRWYMFFEVLNDKTERGCIGLASSKDAVNWNYEKIVLDEPFHLSFPYVFSWESSWYMIPETSAARSIRLYKAKEFPNKWLLVSELLAGKEYADSAIFQFDDLWWLFSTTFNDLRLFHAKVPIGPWVEHPASPIASGDQTSRSGGRVLVLKDQILRYAQEVHPIYGRKLHGYEITKLTVDEYKERRVQRKAILGATGTGWNGGGMHHIDASPYRDGWIAAVDGRGSENFVFGRKQKISMREFVSRVRCLIDPEDKGSVSIFKSHVCEDLTRPKRLKSIL
jgi:hypothetical protein